MNLSLDLVILNCTDDWDMEVMERSLPEPHHPPVYGNIDIRIGRGGQALSRPALVSTPTGFGQSLDLNVDQINSTQLSDND